MDPTLVRNFALALFIGALVGIDREKKKAREREGIGGIRTFILLAQAGAVSAWLSLKLATPWIFVAATLGVCAAVVAGYVLQARAIPGSFGLTTELAAIAVFLLGGAALFGPPEVAVALGIATSAVLAYKQPLHGLVERIGMDDLYAGLKLLVASFIVLPLLPDRAVDPLGALNPYGLWLLVILISGLSLVGYVAVRWLGTERGTAVTGLAGGLVSSTAVTLTFAKRSREEPGAAIGDALAAGTLLAWAVMFARVVVEVAVVHPPLVADVLLPFAAMAAAAALVAARCYWRGAGAPRGVAGRPEQVELRNPFSLTSAVRFAAFFALVLVVVKLVQRTFPGEGLYAVAALAGLADVDAITLSMAKLAREGGATATAVTAITIAALSNTLVKAGMVGALATGTLKSRVGLAAGAILAAGAAALLAG